MICGYCGTELPATALFCGECGRSLAQTTGRPAPIATPDPPREPQPFASPTPDTSIVDLEAFIAAEIEGATVVTRSRPTPVVEPVVTPAEPAPPAPITVEDPPPTPARDPWTPPAHLLATTPPVDEHDLEKTRIVTSTLTGTRFVLQFSTGESVTVFGTGLIGRNPVREPAEYFDHMVTIVDPGKSVSKTHLEFGQDGGMFWVSDRFSGNGTVIREPEADPRRCEPGRRYRITRGSRVTMGEQFFVVS